MLIVMLVAVVAVAVVIVIVMAIVTVMAVMVTMRREWCWSVVVMSASRLPCSPDIARHHCPVGAVARATIRVMSYSATFHDSYFQVWDGVLDPERVPSVLEPCPALDIAVPACPCVAVLC